MFQVRIKQNLYANQEILVGVILLHSIKQVPQDLAVDLAVQLQRVCRPGVVDCQRFVFLGVVQLCRTLSLAVAGFRNIGPVVKVAVASMGVSRTLVGGQMAKESSPATT